MRQITSIVLALAFIVVAVTGVQLDLSHGAGAGGKPSIVRSNVERNSIEGGTSHVPHQEYFYPKAAHKWAGYLFIVAGCMHLVLNLRPMLSYLGIRR